MEAAVTERTKTSLPFYYYYHWYGLVIFHWWAAIMGCDISVDECGIAHVGPKVFFEALRSFDGKPQRRLTAQGFATALLNRAKPWCRELHTSGSIATELQRVVRWFTIDGTCYDPDANVWSISGPIV